MFWDRVAAHEVTLANRRERKKEKRALKTPQKPGAAPPAQVVSPAKSCAGDWPREVFGAAGLDPGFSRSLCAAAQSLSGLGAEPIDRRQFRVVLQVLVSE